MTVESTVMLASALALVIGPLLLGLAGLVSTRRATTYPIPHIAVAWDWRLTTTSALLYTIAFNVIFFIQELFLVLPKALVPGLRPTLFHNNHGWEGVNDLANLFQGTGALATVLVACVCAALLRRHRKGSSATHLFLFWMAYSGFFMALPQVAIGAFNSQNDVGMAMDYLGLGNGAKALAALLALAAIPPLALWLSQPLFALIAGMNSLDSAASRTRFIFQTATLPSLIAIPLIIPFRLPREWIEVVLLPVLVTVIGISWIQAGAWCAGRGGQKGNLATSSIAWLVAAALMLLLFFQLVLRTGIRFYCN